MLVIKIETKSGKIFEIVPGKKFFECPKRLTNDRRSHSNRHRIRAIIYKSIAERPDGIDVISQPLRTRYTEIVSRVPVQNDTDFEVELIRNISIDGIRLTDQSSITYITDVDGTNNSVDNENHGFGYHLHLLEKNRRTNVLLIFDNSESTENQNDIPLYWEYHAEGSKVKIDANNIGQSRRRKIYKTSYGIGIRIGFENYRDLSFGSQIFYP